MPPAGPELDPGMEQGAVVDGDEIQIPEIGKSEMLFAVKSTLENVQDGTIEKQEYHLKLVTDGYNKQSGCLTDAEVPLDHCTVMVEKLTAIFNDVEMGLKNEDDYFFELISPSFFYTSGEYHLNEQMETTALACSTIQEFESTKYHLDEQLQSMILELENALEENGEENNLIAYLVCEMGTDLREHLSCRNKTIKEKNNLKRTHEQMIQDGQKLHYVFRNKDYLKCAREEIIQDELKQDNFSLNTDNLKCTDEELIPDEQKHDFVFGKRAVGGNQGYISKIYILLCHRNSQAKGFLKLSLSRNSRFVFTIWWLSVIFFLRNSSVKALPVNTQHPPVTLTAGSTGVIPFACRKPHQFAAKHYTLQLEGKDRPFFMDGIFVVEGLTSTDQVERFDVAFLENDQEMSIEINIAQVSVEDRGIYIAILVVQGDTTESYVMKRAVMIFIPPGPANCFLMPSENVPNRHEVHCHSERGSGDSTLTCFQQEEKIPYFQVGDDQSDSQVVYRRRFWILNINIPVHCCSHDIKEIYTIMQKSCNQFRFPPGPKPESEISTTVKPYTPTEIAPITKPFYMEENNPSSEIYSISGSDRNIDKSPLIISLMFSIIYLII